MFKQETVHKNHPLSIKKIVRVETKGNIFDTINSGDVWYDMMDKKDRAMPSKQQRRG